MGEESEGRTKQLQGLGGVGLGLFSLVGPSLHIEIPLALRVVLLVVSIAMMVFAAAPKRLGRIAVTPALILVAVCLFGLVFGLVWLFVENNRPIEPKNIVVTRDSSAMRQLKSANSEVVPGVSDPLAAKQTHYTDEARYEKRPVPPIKKDGSLEFLSATAVPQAPSRQETPGSIIQVLKDKIEALVHAKDQFEAEVPNVTKLFDPFLSSSCASTGSRLAPYSSIVVRISGLELLLKQTFPTTKFNWDGTDMFMRNPLVPVPNETGLTELGNIERCRRAYYTVKQINTTIEEAKTKFDSEIENSRNQIRVIALRETP